MTAELLKRDLVSGIAARNVQTLPSVLVNDFSALSHTPELIGTSMTVELLNLCPIGYAPIWDIQTLAALLIDDLAMRS